MATRLIIIFFTGVLKVNFFCNFTVRSMLCHNLFCNRCLEATVSVNMLMGKCYVSYDADLEIDVREYTAQASDRFYYREVCQMQTV